ncbi:hypothetical protein VTO73DRAFT_15598 [Trametes versicolor]
MSTLPTISTITSDVTAYQVFALEQYTVFVYDGGSQDRRVYPGSHVLLHESTLARSLAPFHGCIMWPIKFQTDWVVFEVRSDEEPQRRLCLAVRYRRLGGWSRWAAWVVRGLLWTFCLLPRNSFSFPVAAKYSTPHSYELQLRRAPANSTVSSVQSVWWK